MQPYQILDAVRGANAYVMAVAGGPILDGWGGGEWREEEGGGGAKQPEFTREVGA
jgi:hypothetical protein